MREVVNVRYVSAVGKKNKLNFYVFLNEKKSDLQAGRLENSAGSGVLFFGFYTNAQ